MSGIYNSKNIRLSQSEAFERLQKSFLFKACKALLPSVVWKSFPIQIKWWNRVFSDLKLLETTKNLEINSEAQSYLTNFYYCLILERNPFEILFSDLSSPIPLCSELPWELGIHRHYHCMSIHFPTDLIPSLSIAAL